MKFLFFILCIFVVQVVNAEEERVQLKQGVVRNKTIVTPVGVMSFDQVEEKDLMPGNDAFGFFYKSTDSKKGFCRIRIKIVCDYGLEILKEQKNMETQIRFANIYYKSKTDMDGILDVIFRCDSARKDDGVIISLKKHMHSSKLIEVPGELRIPEADCK